MPKWLNAKTALHLLFFTFALKSISFFNIIFTQKSCSYTFHTLFLFFFILIHQQLNWVKPKHHAIFFLNAQKLSFTLRCAKNKREKEGATASWGHTTTKGMTEVVVDLLQRYLTKIGRDGDSGFVVILHELFWAEFA